MNYNLIRKGKTIDGADYYQLSSKYGYVIFAVSDKIYIHAIWSCEDGGMKKMVDYLVDKFKKNAVVFWEPSQQLLRKLRNVIDIKETDIGLLVEVRWDPNNL